MLERGKGIEPLSSTWKEVALPLSYPRIISINIYMNTQKQIIWQLANEHGCRCEICKAGIWLKHLEQLVSLPSYLVLYHKNGDKDNYNLDNIAIRCTYCAKYDHITPASFKLMRKKANKDHGHAGSLWYNNGLMSKFLKPHEIDIFVKMGWNKGRIVKKGPPSTSGKIRITNGVLNSHIWPHEKIKEGWWRGKANFIAKYDSSLLYK